MHTGILQSPNCWNRSLKGFVLLKVGLVVVVVICGCQYRILWRSSKFPLDSTRASALILETWEYTISLNCIHDAADISQTTGENT